MLREEEGAREDEGGERRVGGLRISQWLIMAAVALVLIGARRRIFQVLGDLPGALKRLRGALRTLRMPGASRVSWPQLLALLVIAVLAFVASHPDGPRSW